MAKIPTVIVAAMEDSEALGLRFDPLSGDRCCHSGGTRTQGLRSSGGRTPRVSSGPVSAARKERPALLHPKASRGACQRGTPDAIPASGEDKRDVRSESLPLGALGGFFVVFVSTQ